MRKDICITESLCCTTETNTTLLINYSPTCFFFFLRERCTFLNCRRTNWKMLSEVMLLKNLRDCFKWSGNIITPAKLLSFYRMLAEKRVKTGLDHCQGHLLCEESDSGPQIRLVVHIPGTCTSRLLGS